MNFRLWHALLLTALFMLAMSPRLALAQYCRANTECDPWQTCDPVPDSSTLKACKDLPDVHYYEGEHRQERGETCWQYENCSCEQNQHPAGDYPNCAPCEDKGAMTACRAH